MPLKSFISRLRFMPLSCCWSVSLMLATISFWSGTASAEFFVPQSLGGQLSYGYGFNRAANAESERTMVSVSVGTSGYFWEPWFLTLGANVGLNLGETVSNPGGTSQSTSVSGELDFTLFPRSRFPTDFGYAVTNSKSEMVDSTLTRDQEYEVRRFYINQHYTGRDNLRLTAWLNQSTVDAFSEKDSEIWSFGVEATKRQAYQIMDGGMRANKVNTVGDAQESRDSNIFFNHGYYPGPEEGVISLLNYARSQTQASDTASTESSSAQASSTFYWRPEHKPYHVTGGVRFFVSDPNGTGKQRSAATSVATSYRVSRNTRMGLGVNFNVADSGDVQTTTISELLNATYNSDPYRFWGLDYSWGAGASASNTTFNSDGNNNQTSGTSTQTGTEDTQEGSTQSVGGSLSHRLTKGWVLGRYSSAHISVGQGGGASKTNTDVDPVYNVTHSAGIGWSRSAPGAQTSSSLQFSDSRSYADVDTVFQSLNFQLSRQQAINRLSGVTGSLNYQATKSFIKTTDQTQTQTAVADDNGKLYEGGGAALSYNHSRFLGIYRLRFDSSMTTRNMFRSETGAGGSGNNSSSNNVRDERNITLDWRNNLTYNIGLLFTSLSYNVSDLGGENRSTSFFFRATRSF